MSAPVAEGDIVLDKYRVERVLGRGGMGVVVAATHVDLDKKVALKFLLPSALEHAELVERFAREARAAAKILSQHVVRVLDTGRMPSGAPFMVMEYLEGEDLGELLKRSGPIAPNVVADYLLQACEAIGEAHAAGIVHRDLKPSNLFLAKQRDRRSIVKVLDFGISKVQDPAVAPLTRTTAAMGSPHYMSPEQLVSSKDVDARSDVWSLGVILYELVAGKRPFEGDTMPEVVGQILNNEPERLGVVREGISLDLELVVARCLASSAKDRFQSVAELAQALRPFATDAAAASVSVGRITRVLGGASIPPAAGAPAAANGRAVVTLLAPEANAVPAPDAMPCAKANVTDEEIAPTVRPPASPPPAGDVERERELGLASTTPATGLSGSLPAGRMSPSERPPSRRALFAVGAVALCVLAVAGLRVATARPSAERALEIQAAAASSAAPSGSAAPEAADSGGAGALDLHAAASASATPSAITITDAHTSPRSAPVGPKTITPPRPSGRAQTSAPAATGSAHKEAPRGLDMDIK